MQDLDDFAIGFERGPCREDHDGDGAQADKDEDGVGEQRQHARHAGELGLPALVGIKADAWDLIAQGDFEGSEIRRMVGIDPDCDEARHRQILQPLNAADPWFEQIDRRLLVEDIDFDNSRRRFQDL